VHVLLTTKSAEAIALLSSSLPPRVRAEGPAAVASVTVKSCTVLAVVAYLRQQHLHHAIAAQAQSQWDSMLGSSSNS
jgi:hypothetical protein